MEAQVLIKLTAVIGKLEITDKLKTIDKQTDEEVGKEMIMLIATNLYKAENEVYELISAYKKISVEEAKSANIIDIVKEIISIDGVKGFFS